MINIRKKAVVNRRPVPKIEEEKIPHLAERRSSDDFLHLLKNGDEAAWQQLTSEWSPRLYRYLRCNLPSVEDVEDVLSDTMIATVQAIGNFDGNAAISTFIYSIAKRKVADFWRKRKEVFELPETVSTSGPTSMGIELQEALSELPDTSRQALILRYHVGMGVDEVAEVLGKSYKATESLLSRGRSRLQAVLKDADIKE